jgi:acyl carrier protein
MLADMWAEVLNLGRVGVDDNFFDLGGHSLIMVQLHNKLREALNRKVSIIDMFKYPTISALAAHLGGEEAGESEQGPSDERVESRKTSRRRQRARRQGGK